MNTPPRSFAAPPPLPPSDKAQLRTAMREVRRALRPGAAVAAGQAAQAFLEAAVADVGGRVVAVYAAQGSEFDAWPLAEALRARGARIALPVVVARDQALAFRELNADDPLTPDAAGLPAPPATAAALRPDLVFAPLLAFDRLGGRLGQGGGYYDRTLQALRAAGQPVTALGLGFAGQEVGRIPMGEHDARLDGVLTERGLALFSPLTLMGV